MKTHVTCETCGPGRDDCTFAMYTRVIDGEEHRFCCERHAEAYLRTRADPSE